MPTLEPAEQIGADLSRLCDPGDRDLGTGRNRAATSFVGERMRELGLEVEELQFDVPEWRFGSASLGVGDTQFAAHPGPFSDSCRASGRLLVVRSWQELEGLDAAGAVVLVCDEAAREPLTPRGYPFYDNPEHTALANALETGEPVAIVAATTSHEMAGALSPFPLIEEPGFRIPTAYLSAELGAELATHVGQDVSVHIESQTLPSSGVQLIGRRQGTSEASAGVIVVSAHVDTKPETPGAIDNASGVVMLLAVASLLQGREIACGIEFVPFNGEDHTLAPGEMAYLSARQGIKDVRLNINIDGAGLPDAPSAYSVYGISDDLAEKLARVAALHPDTVAEGPAWPASDHMIFAMSGVPAIAITSSDFEAFTRVYAHTPADVPAILDAKLLAETARFVAALIETL